MGEHPEGRWRCRPARQDLHAGREPDGPRRSWGGQRRWRIAAATSPWLLVAAGLGAAWWYLNRLASTRQRVASIAKSILTCALDAAIADHEVQDQFTSAAP